MSYKLWVMSYREKKLPLVVIFGRTNVGKSTLFNRLIGERRALVSDIEGTTRDINRGVVNWRNKSLAVIDTGGIIDPRHLISEKIIQPETIEAKVLKQARLMLKQADLILFLVDVQTGLLPQDRQMALFLKKHCVAKNILLVVNKADNPRLRQNVAEFHKLALGEPLLISAATGSGTGDLLDIVIKKLAKSKKSDIPKKEGKINNKILAFGSSLLPSINICILGKPNVGKSSLLNAILGEERVIVSPLPHTTREPQDTLIAYQNKVIKLIDTAGISKKGLRLPFRKREKKEALEKMGIAKSLKALSKSDIALLIIDISQPITHAETKIAEEIISRKTSMIIVANKWDLIRARDAKKFTDYIYAKLPFAHWAPIQFVSALTSEKINKIMDLVLKVNEERKKEIADDALNNFLSRIVRKHKPTKGRGVKRPRIRQFKQIKTNPPVFLLHIGLKEDLHFSYLRFIENRLREKFGFLGTPITITIFKNKTAHEKLNS